MNFPLTLSPVQKMGRQAREASHLMSRANTAQKNAALLALAFEIRHAKAELLAANENDLKAAAHLDAPLRDRLNFGGDKGIEAMAVGVEEVALLPDPVGEISNMVARPSGIHVGQMRVPLGVIAIIYESRPNVTVEASALCLKSGNTAILRGGSESLQSNLIVAGCLKRALEKSGLPANAVQIMESTDRSWVGELLRLTEDIDLIVPRGGKGLLKRLQEESRIPMLMHLDGNCHVYVDDGANLDMALRIVDNAKTQRFGTCNTIESLLVAESVAKSFLPQLALRMSEKKIELRACAQSLPLLKGATVVPAQEADWYAEYLGPVLSVKMVSKLDEAIMHINHYSSHHTDAIITENYSHAQRFLREVDSSSVMVNASTRFADGFEYGLGAEIGISTDKLHARGPVGLEGLTTQKWIVLGQGEIRT